MALAHFTCQFRCEVGECTSKFSTKDELRSHVRFFRW